VIAGLSAISVRRYRFAASPWQYELSALRSLNDEYRGAGWKKLMNKNHEGDFSMTADRRWSEGARCQPPA
jgi:hypothetical protein